MFSVRRHQILFSRNLHIVRRTLSGFNLLQVTACIAVMLSPVSACLTSLLAYQCTSQSLGMTKQIPHPPSAKVRASNWGGEGELLLPVGESLWQSWAVQTSPCGEWWHTPDHCEIHRLIARLPAFPGRISKGFGDGKVGVTAPVWCTDCGAMMWWRTKEWAGGLKVCPSAILPSLETSGTGFEKALLN